MDWVMMIVNEIHPGPGLVQLLQDVQESGVGGVDVILNQRKLLG